MRVIKKIWTLPWQKCALRILTWSDINVFVMASSFEFIYSV